MNKLRKTLASMTMLVMVLFLCLPMTARAEGTTTIHLSSNNPSVGDKLSVTVVASESASISVQYNSGVLQFDSCSAGGSGEGGTVTFEGSEATISFTAIAEGSSSIIVSSSTVTGSSVSITVGSGQQKQEEQEEKPEEEPDTTTSGEGQFTIGGVAYVVSERFSDDEVPSGFEVVRVSVQGESYKAISDGTLTLLYLKPAADTSQRGKFFVYDTEAEKISDLPIIFTGLGYVLLKTPDAMLMDGMTETTLVLDGVETKVYALGDGTEFYFVYGIDNHGVEGWYQYDTTYGTLQRVNTQLLQGNQSQAQDTSKGQITDFQKKWSQQRYLLAGMAFVIVVMVVVIVNLAISLHRYKDMDEYDDEYDEEDDYREEESDDTEEYEDAVEELLAREAKAAKEAERAAEMMKAHAVNEEKVDEMLSEEVDYSDIRGTEAFRGAKDTHYKSNTDNHVDIIDLNDL